jgi:hypothetical protein
MSTEGKSKRYKKVIFMRNLTILFIFVIEAQRGWEKPCGNKRLRRRQPLGPGASVSNWMIFVQAKRKSAPRWGR